jgi:diaminopimelate decarboxylase
MKNIPFTKVDIERLSAVHPTPFYVYDEAGIRETTKGLIEAFSWNKGFREYFAVKATPNPRLLSILKEEGCGADASSLAELVLAERVGLSGEEIMFTSNNTSAEEFVKARALGALINLDDVSHFSFLQESAGLPDIISCRYNPGSARAGNAIIGKPEEAKFGMTKEQLFETYRLAKAAGIRRFGLHTMIASNELDIEYFVETAIMLFDLVLEIQNELGITFEFANLGGGIGIPYKPDQSPVDISALGERVRAEYERRKFHEQAVPLKIFLECGRYITGPHGFLVSKVRHLKSTYREYAGLDASMNDLMRPGMYGAYHHITVLGKEAATADHIYDVTGSLCENNDKFAVQRPLPELMRGDIVVIHDAGAHGSSMGFNYNGKLRSAEFLRKENGEFEMIRRAETLDDYFATTNGY